MRANSFKERLKRTQHAGMMRPKVERGEAQIATITSVYCFSKAKHRIQFHLEFLSIYFWECEPLKMLNMSEQNETRNTDAPSFTLILPPAL